ncbi:MAG TPA: preprotein translocase subunit SecG [Symbiobacteriaceae bacterium]|nr:preprotein translocase subunit SecG [Symbiobacteriaceae bacterium]
MLNTIVTVIHTLFAIGLVSTVLMQSGRSAGLGTISGGAEQIFGKKKGMDEMLNRMSTIFAVLFICTSLGLLFLQRGGQ